LAYEEPPIGKAPQDGAPTGGTTLLMLDESSDMSAVVLALTARGFRPVMMPVAEDAKEIVSRWEPQAVILRAGLPDWLALLRFLGRRGVPCVLIGTSEQLRSAEQYSSRCLHLLLPVEPDEVAEGARLVIGPRSSGGRPAVIDLGVIKIDLRARTVLVDGAPEVLPPKEFEILVQLALQPGAPLDSTELLGRVWRGSESATVDDVHTRVWRLRRMLGDHHRQRPLIVNRRGFGYVLNVGALPSG
jgi:DNA-binding response OmpR family regulator